MARFSLVICALIALTDQIIKYFVNMLLKPVGRIEVIENLLTLTYVENKGAALGMLSNMRWLFIAVTTILIAVLLYLMIIKKIDSKLFYIAAALIAGGGIGNLIDRIYLGYVIDYLYVTFFPPVCNFADYCITMGTVLLIIFILFYSDFFDGKKQADHV